MELERVWADFDLLRAPQTEKPTSNLEYFCESCGAPKAFDGEAIDLPTCTGCGRVDDAFVSDEPEWRSGGDDGEKADPSRVGAPVNTDHFSEAWGRTTYFTPQRGASYATKRLARIHQHASMNHRDRALFHAYAELDNIGKGILNLPDVVMYAIKSKYRAFNEAVLTRGAVRSGIKANCVLQACHELGCPRTTQQVADAFGIPARDLARTSEMYQEQVPETSVHVITPADLVARFFNDITGIPQSERGRLKMRIIARCKELEDKVELMGRTPKAVACAVMASVLKGVPGAPDRQTLCRICDISLPTLSKIEALVKD
jgi:transcription initiation factor TFIIIB Brf1 subunit/transcription initiation factor TFIIB